MTKLISMNDRIPVEIDDITIYISPLSYAQKMELQSYMANAIKGDFVQAMKGAAMAVKYAIKDIDGVEDFEGYKFKLDFEEDGKSLSEACVDNLLNLPQNSKIITTCSALLQGIPLDGIRHPETDEIMKGITIGDVMGKTPASKKKKVAGS